MPDRKKNFASKTCPNDCTEGCRFFQAADEHGFQMSRAAAIAFENCENHADVAIALELISSRFDETDSGLPTEDSEN